MVNVEKVEYSHDYKLKTKLSNGVEGLFDVSPYLDKGIFAELKDVDYLKKVKAAFGGICWPNGQDFCVDTLEVDLEEIGRDQQ